MKQAFADVREVTAAPDAVWAALTDWTAAPQWMPGVEGMRADRPLEVGTVLAYRARGRGRTSTVVALEPGQAVTLRSVVGGVTADYAYSVRPGTRPGTSRVELDARVATRGLVWLLAPVIRGAIAKEDRVQLSRLKAWIEGAVSPAHP